MAKVAKVAYSDPAPGAPSGIYLDGLFKRPGIHQVSEILPVSGVVLVGALLHDHR